MYLRLVAILVVLALGCANVCTAESEADAVDAVYDLKMQGPNKAPLELSVINNPDPTDLEGQLDRKYHFYSVKFPYRGNHMGINLPEEAYFASKSRKLEKLIFDILRLYDDIYTRARDLFGAQGGGIKQNLTFGGTSSGYPFVKIYSKSKTANIFMDTMPYSDKGVPLSPQDEDVLKHELGHAFFALAIGNFSHPKFKAIEEGVLNYLTYGEAGDVRDRRIIITEEQAKSLDGLAQIDVDVSIWRAGILDMEKTPKGYKGITLHYAGEEFILAFISVFGEDNLLPFLKRLKVKDTEPLAGDHGSDQIRDVLKGMGYSREEIEGFEKAFHERLLGNVFVVSG